jgi:hypothetical protein
MTGAAGLERIQLYHAALILALDGRVEERPSRLRRWSCPRAATPSGW